MGKLSDIYEKFNINFDKKARIMLGLFLIVIIVLLIVSGTYFSDKNKNSGDTNVYLKEKVCFADEIYFSVDSINITKNDNSNAIDEDGDELSEYTLNLGVLVEQRHTDLWINKVKIKPSCFKLKSVNLKAKTKMEVFFECLAKETFSLMLGGAVGGSINVIDETINYAADYTLASIENVETNKTDFKPIKCSDDSFKDFYPYKVEGTTRLDLSFPIKKEYTESENVIVLTIDNVTHIEKRIFLITRPTMVNEN